MMIVIMRRCCKVIILMVLQRVLRIMMVYFLTGCNAKHAMMRVCMNHGIAKDGVMISISWLS